MVKFSVRMDRYYGEAGGPIHRDPIIGLIPAGRSSRVAVGDLNGTADVPLATVISKRVLRWVGHNRSILKR